MDMSSPSLSSMLLPQGTSIDLQNASIMDTTMILLSWMLRLTWPLELLTVPTESMSKEGFSALAGAGGVDAIEEKLGRCFTLGVGGIYLECRGLASASY